jgi:hypothetical protein
MTIPIRTMRGSGKIWYIVEAYIEQIILIIKSFSTKFSENLPNKLKITKNSMCMGKFKPLEKKPCSKLQQFLELLQFHRYLHFLLVTKLHCSKPLELPILFSGIFPNSHFFSILEGVSFHAYMKNITHV